MSEQTPGKSQDRFLVGLLTANATLVAWLVFLGFGSAFLAFFYSHIHYFPELKWEESFTYLAAVSILGGGVVAIYGLLLFVPGWIWSEFLIFDAELEKGTLCFLSGPEEKRPEPCFWSVLRHVVLPFAALMVALHLALYAGDPGLLIATAVMGIVGVSWYSLREFRRELADRLFLPPGASLRSLLVKYVLTADVAALSGIASLFIISRLAAGEHSIGLLTICTLGVVVSNLLVAVQFRRQPARAVVTSIIAAVTLMICGETLSAAGASLSERLLAKFGIGDTNRKFSLVFKEKEGEAFAQKNHLEGAEVALLSRLGEEYFVEAKSPQGVAYRIALPKKLVASWSSREPEPIPRPSFSYATMRGGNWAAEVIVLVLTALVLPWAVIRYVVKEWSELKRIFLLKAGPSLPPLLQTPEGPRESVVFLEINRSVTVTTELSGSN